MILALLSYFQTSKDLKYYSRSKIIIIISVFISLFMGLRYRVGSDSVFYHYIFSSGSALDNFNSFASISPSNYLPGWNLFSFLLSRTNSFAFFQLVFSSLLVLCVSWSLIQVSRLPVLSLSIYSISYLVYHATEVLRESLSVSIFSCGLILLWCSVSLKSRAIGSILVLLSLTLHTTAFLLVLIFVPLLIFSKVRKPIDRLGLGGLFFTSFLILIFFFRATLVTAFAFESYDSFSIEPLTITGYLYFFLFSLPCFFLLWANIMSARPSSTCTTNSASNLLSCCAATILILLFCRLFVNPYFDRIISSLAIFYVAIVADLLVRCSIVFRSSRHRSAFCSFALIPLCCFYVILPGLSPTEFSPDSLEIHRFYPYSSVFDRTTYPLREQIISAEGKEPVGFDDSSW